MVSPIGLTFKANVLFTLGLHKRLEGTNVTVNVLHPGVIKTELARDVLPKILAIVRVSAVPGNVAYIVHLMLISTPFTESDTIMILLLLL